jgi:hypothetical protein
MITCPVCGTEQPDSKVRCDATLDNGAECRKDLTGETSSTADSRAVTTRVGK